MKTPHISSRTVIVVFLLGFLTAVWQADTVQAQIDAGRKGAGRKGGDREGRRGDRGGRGFGRGSLVFIALQEPVQKELQLSDDQVKQLKELSQSSRPDFSVIRELSDEERSKYFEQQRKKSEERLKQIISQTQIVRLGQLKLHFQGPTALLQDELAAEFKIEDKQKEQLEEVAQQRRDAMRGLSFDERDRIRAEWNAKLLAVLTPEQKQLWTAKIGPPPAAAPQPRPSGIRPSRPLPTQPQVVTSQPAASSGSVQVTSEGSVVPQKVIASFSAGAQENSKKGSTQKKRPHRRERTGLSNVGGSQMVSFNFANAPWADVLEMFAETAELTLHKKSTPTGTFNYIDDGLYTPAEALDILNGYLLQEGHIMVRRDRFLVIVSLSETIPPNLIPKIPASELPYRGRNELLEVRFKLPEGLDAQETATQVEDMLGPQGDVVALSTLGSLSVRDIGSNLMEIKAMIDDSENPNSTVFKAFKLAYISVYDAEKIISSQLGLDQGVRNVSRGASDSSSRSFSGRSFSRFGSSRGGSDAASRIREWMASRSGGGGFGGFGSRPGGADSSRGSRRDSRTSGSSSSRSTTTAETPIVTSEPRTNTLLVSAPAKKMKIVEEIITTIDVRQEGGPNSPLVDNRSGQPYLKVYKVYRSDAVEVTKTLGVLMPGVVVNEDGRNRTIHVLATADQHREVEKWINQLDGGGADGQQVAVISLYRMDPLQAAAILNSLYINETSNPPTIMADPYSRNLLVRATSSQIMDIRKVLLDYGETGNGTLVAGSTGPRLPVRTIRLGDRDPEKIARMLQQMLEGSGQFENRVRVVVPSSDGDSIRRQVPSARQPLEPNRRGETPTNFRPRRPRRPQEEPVKNRPETKQERKAADNNKTVRVFVSFQHNNENKKKGNLFSRGSRAETDNRCTGQGERK